MATATATTTMTQPASSSVTTTAIELDPIGPSAAVPSFSHSHPPSEQQKGWGKGIRLGDGGSSDSPQLDSEWTARGAEGQEPPGPTPAVAEVQHSWNYPRSNAPRVAATFWSFIVMGANDAAYGALIPSLERYYDLNFVIVSLVFLSPFVGYTLSAVLNNRVHLWAGQRGVAFISPLCHLAAYAITAAHPPYPALVVAFSIAGFGNGLADAAWNAWIGSMNRANEVLGFLHGFYGLGAVVSPLVATTMTARAGLPWYTFYYVMIGMAGLELITSVAAFWRADSKAYRDSTAHSNPTNTNTSSDDDSPSKGGLREALFKRPKARVTWLVSLFLLAYVGVEVAIGGWIVTFMIRMRQAGDFESGMTAMGFWLGLMVGRVVLGFVTPRIGEKLAISIYLPITIGMHMLFWLVPQFYVSAVAVGLTGFFLGPLFPGAIVVATRLLPKHLHVSAIGFAAAFGGSGAAILPFAVGAVAQAKGVTVLQPIILGLLGVLFALWLCLPRMNKKTE